MTTFDEVYDIALWKFYDRDLPEYTDEDRESIMAKYLLPSASHAAAVTGDPSFNIDLTTGEFNGVLTNEQIDIVATGMAYEWYSRRVINSETIRNRLSNKDYSNHSPGTLLEAMVKLRAQLKDDLDTKLIEYSFRRGDVSKWKAQ
jgi:hypothetical protein